MEVTKYCEFQQQQQSLNPKYLCEQVCSKLEQLAGKSLSTEEGEAILLLDPNPEIAGADEPNHTNAIDERRPSFSLGTLSENEDDTPNLEMISLNQECQFANQQQIDVDNNNDDLMIINSHNQILDSSIDNILDQQPPLMAQQQQAIDSAMVLSDYNYFLNDKEAIDSITSTNKKKGKSKNSKMPDEIHDATGKGGASFLQSYMNQKGDTKSSSNTGSGGKRYQQQTGNDMQDLTPSQEKIIEAFQEQEQWDMKLLRFRQSLPGFLMGIFRRRKNMPLLVEDIYKLVQPWFQYMKKREGGKYQGKLHGSVQGALFSGHLFVKDCKGFWRMNNEKCTDYEAQITGFKPTGSNGSLKQIFDNRSKVQQTSFMKTKNDKKRKRELIEKFEMIYQKIAGKLDNPFKSVKTETMMIETFNRMDEQRKRGYLHSFILLREQLRRAARQEERVQEAIQILQGAGLIAKHMKSSGGLAASETIPIITQQDAGRLLEIEVHAQNINDRVNSIHQKVKESLDKYSYLTKQQQKEVIMNTMNDV